MKQQTISTECPNCGEDHKVVVYFKIKWGEIFVIATVLLLFSIVATLLVMNMKPIVFNIPADGWVEYNNDDDWTDWVRNNEYEEATAVREALKIANVDINMYFYSTRYINDKDGCGTHEVVVLPKNRVAEKVIGIAIDIPHLEWTTHRLTMIKISDGTLYKLSYIGDHDQTGHCVLEGVTFDKIIK